MLTPAAGLLPTSIGRALIAVASTARLGGAAAMIGGPVFQQPRCDEQLVPAIERSMMFAGKYLEADTARANVRECEQCEAIITTTTRRGRRACSRTQS